MTQTSKATLYTRYPGSSITIYNLVTILHFALGGAGIMLGYNFSWLLVVLLLAVVGLLLFRFFAIFGRIACPHCQAREECPNAR